MTTQATLDYVPDEPEKDSKIERKGAIDSSRETSKHKSAGLQTPKANAPDVSGDAGSTPAEVKIKGSAESAPATTPLAVIEVKRETALSVFTAEKGLDPYLAELERQARASIAGADVSTIAGQDIIRSVSYSVSKSKKPLENLAAELKKEAYALVEKVNDERDRGIKVLDDLQKELRRPLTEYEEKESERKAAHLDRIRQINDLAVFQGDVDSVGLQGRLDYLAASFKDMNWQEFTESAKTATDTVTKTLNDMLEKAKKAEADAAELERLRTEKAARDQKERDDKIAADAAAQAKKDAEELAEKQRLEREEQVEKDKQAAQKVIDDQAAALAVAETNRKNTHEQRLEKMAAMTMFQEEPSAAAIQARIENLKDFEGIDWQEYQQRAVDTKIKVGKELADFLHETQIAEGKKAAEAKRISDEKAAQAERDRIAEEQRVQKEADDKRAADTKHKAKINNEILTALKAIGMMDDQTWKDVITAIAQGKIPHTTIKY